MVVRTEEHGGEILGSHSPNKSSTFVGESPSTPNVCWGLALTSFAGANALDQVLPTVTLVVVAGHTDRVSDDGAYRSVFRLTFDGGVPALPTDPPPPLRPLPPAVEAALAGVMADVDAHGIGLRLQAPLRPGGGAPGLHPGGVRTDDEPADFWVWQDDASGTGCFVDPEASDAECAAHVADVVHEAAIDALWGQGRDTAWPSCPSHPGAHPLVVAQGDSQPRWACPRSGTVHAPVGGLGEEERARFWEETRAALVARPGVELEDHEVFDRAVHDGLDRE